MTNETSLAIIDPSLGPLRDPATYSPRFTGRVVTIVGMRTTTTRFVPKSHEGFSNEAYVDKEWIAGKKRVAFTARKQKATERRSHMRLLREYAGDAPKVAGRLDKSGKAFEVAGAKEKRINTALEEPWQCELPHGLCLRCPNCTLFGALRPGAQFALMARARYQDSFSLEPTHLCVANDESDSGDMGIDGMAIGNTQSESLMTARSSSSFFFYEYVRPGAHFPFILSILDPSALDVAGTLAAIDLAAATGYGSYSSNQGKFRTRILALASGLPRFSVLDMIEWCDDLAGARENLGRDEVYLSRILSRLGDPQRWIGQGVVLARPIEAKSEPSGATDEGDAAGGSRVISEQVPVVPVATQADGLQVAHSDEDLGRKGAALFEKLSRELNWAVSSRAILESFGALAEE